MLSLDAGIAGLLTEAFAVGADAAPSSVAALVPSPVLSAGTRLLRDAAATASICDLRLAMRCFCPAVSCTPGVCTTGALASIRCLMRASSASLRTMPGVWTTTSGTDGRGDGGSLDC